MKTKEFILIFCFFFFTIISSSSEEIQFDSSNMDIKNEGNLIIAYNSKLKLPNKQVFISSKKATYDKLNNFLTFENNVYLKDEVENIIIESDKINYDRNKNLFFSIGDTEINLNEKYHIKSKNIFFDRGLNIIYGNYKTIIKDNKKIIII